MTGLTGLVVRVVRSAPLQQSTLRNAARSPSCIQNPRFSSSQSKSNSLNRPSPPPLPREDQREFEDLVRKAQAPLSQTSVGRDEAEAELALHPDARKPVASEFEGDVNPTTGEQGGPKREPVRKWSEGDWSFKGRVSDF